MLRNNMDNMLQKIVRFFKDIMVYIMNAWFIGVKWAIVVFVFIIMLHALFYWWFEIIGK